jgi:hypothetical protein
MLSGIKPLAIIKRQAKELLPPKLVDRLIYAAKNFPEIGWLEILPKEEGKEVRKRTSFMKAWNERSSEFGRGVSARFPVGHQGPKEAPGA